MRLLFRFSVALLGVGGAISTSQAFWWHKKECATHAAAPAASCESAACAPAVTYVPQTQNVVTTRTVMVPVQQQVVTQRTVMVPVAAPPRAAGCYGSGAGAGSGCTGAGAGLGSGCTGAGAGAGCFGSSTGAGTGCCGGGTGLPGKGGAVFNNDQSSLTDPGSAKLAKLENKIMGLENKIDALTEALTEAGAKSPSRSSLPPIPPIPAGALKPTPLGSATPTENDPILAAARAYKARQAAAATPVPAAAGAETGVTRK